MSETQSAARVRDRETVTGTTTPPRQVDRRARGWLVPEVIQTSNMDCGPAALKAILEGFGISVGYGRLREVCQTDVDGTSIDNLEEVLNALGLCAEQSVLPRDHVLLPPAQVLPALVTMRIAGNNHFVVAWRKVGPMILVMDPAIGRHWVHERNFLGGLYIHSHLVEADAWRSWAVSDSSRTLLSARLERLGALASQITELLEEASADPSWRSLACLDAAIRQTDRLVHARALRTGAEAIRILREVLRAEAHSPGMISPPYWSLVPAESEPGTGAERIVMRGAVLLRVTRQNTAGGTRDAAAARREESLAAELRELTPPVLLGLFALIREGGLLLPALLALQIVVAAVAVVLQVVLLRAAFALPWYLAPGGPRLSGVFALLAFSIASAALELATSTGALRVGRHLEARLRLAYYRKVPRVEARYFQSRLVSDMAERAHMLHAVRGLPVLIGQTLRAGATLAAIAAAMVWVEPRLALYVLALISCAVSVPLVLYPALRRRDLRLRTFDGALSRFYLDALRGLAAIRSHSAERAVRREHEALLTDYSATALEVSRLQVIANAILAIGCSLLAIALVARYLSSDPAATGLLLLTYWALEVPVLGEEFVESARQYPRLRNILLRVLEILSATEQKLELDAAPTLPESQRSVARAIVFEDVSVRSGGRTVLEGVRVTIAAGEHVAIVGRSGAGKSTLIGLLLGFYRPATGAIRIDGNVLSETALAQLRTETAWVEPAVQLWNKSALDNMRGAGRAIDAVDLAAAIDAADLGPVFDKLPEGLRTQLGEGGGLVSGGEGQRLRLGRALCQSGVRLVLLDEPFRGLAREQRALQLERLRMLWREQTLLCVLHDVRETASFARVLVIDGGRVVEDGAPEELLARAGSSYAKLMDAERRLLQDTWRVATWRRWAFGKGSLVE